MIETGPSLRFLVVDDDEHIRSAFTDILEHLGHTADRAGDGVQAVEAIAGDTYDFILLDLGMPHMSGKSFLEWLRDHPEWSGGARVVVVSGALRDDRTHLEELGAHAVLAKPVSIQDLRDVIRGTTPHVPDERRTPTAGPGVENEAEAAPTTGGNGL